MFLSFNHARPGPALEIASPNSLRIGVRAEIMVETRGFARARTPNRIRGRSRVGDSFLDCYGRAGSWHGQGLRETNDI